MRDVRHMARGLRRSPGFAIAVVLTLALGIGGNTAIFSVVDQLLLRPLPYPAWRRAADGLRVVLPDGRGRHGRATCLPANWLDWQRESRTLQALAAWRTYRLTLTGVGDPTRLNAQVVSSEFFPLLGVEPLSGRTISEEDDRPNAPRVARAQPSPVAAAVRRRSDSHRPRRPVERSAGRGSSASCPPASASCTRTTTCGPRSGSIANQPWRETAGRFMNVVGRLKPGNDDGGRAS